MITLSTLNSKYLPPARPTAHSDSDPSSEPQPRKIKGSFKLKRWSIGRAIQTGRKLDRPSHRNPVAEINSPVQQPKETEFRDSAAPARERDGEIAELTTAKSIYIISDGTRRTATAEHAVNSALGQCCSGCPVKTHLFSGIDDAERLMQIIKQAAQEGALVVYALADPSMSEAMEFTTKQDDGALPENLYKADIVLAGISRTGKTRLSIYLAQKGYKVANVPIVMGVKLPESLFSVDPEKVFGLTINPGVLQEIRRARVKSLGFTGEARSNYSEMDHVREELEFARRVFAQNPVWPVIEVTGKAIEETAAVVLRLYHDRKNKCKMPAISERY